MLYLQIKVDVLLIQTNIPFLLCSYIKIFLNEYLWGHKQYNYIKIAQHKTGREVVENLMKKFIYNLTKKKKRYWMTSGQIEATYKKIIRTLTLLRLLLLLIPIHCRYHVICIILRGYFGHGPKRSEGIFFSVYCK